VLLPGPGQGYPVDFVEEEKISILEEERKSVDYLFHRFLFRKLFFANQCKLKRGRPSDNDAAFWGFYWK